ENPTKWTRENPLTKDEIIKSIELLQKEDKDVYIGFFPGEIKRGKHKGKYTWGVDFDDKTLVTDIKITLQQCKKRGVWIEPSRSKGHHMYGITNTISHDEKLHDLKIELFGTQNTFLIVYNNFEHDLYDLSPVDIEKSWKELQGYIKKIKKIPKKEKKGIVDLKKGVSHGQRNVSAFKLACSYRDKQLSIEETTKLIMDWNRKNYPPIHDQEIINCIKSAYKKDIPVVKEKSKIPILEEYGVLIRDKNENITGINPIKLAKLILEGDGRHYIVIKDNMEIFSYNGSYYEPSGDALIKERVQYYLKDIDCIKGMNQHKKEVVEYIRNHAYVDREKLNPPIRLINVKNGIYDIATSELLEHCPTYHFLQEINVNYDPNAEIVEIKEFFESTLNLNDIPIISPPVSIRKTSIARKDFTCNSDLMFTCFPYNSTGAKRS
ncbi:unnamed protein product, partial [marine sediment metagenome]